MPRVLVALQSIRALASFAPLTTDHYAVLLACTAVGGFGDRGSRVITKLCATRVAGPDRVRYQAINRTATKAGWTLGGLAAPRRNNDFWSATPSGSSPPRMARSHLPRLRRHRGRPHPRRRRLQGRPAPPDRPNRPRTDRPRTAADGSRQRDGGGPPGSLWPASSPSPPPGPLAGSCSRSPRSSRRAASPCLCRPPVRLPPRHCSSPPRPSDSRKPDSAPPDN